MTEETQYYLAYGSNLSMAQMAQRCPDAYYVGTAWLENYQLLFRGNQRGYYLTAEPKAGSRVPLLVWKISSQDEKYLDEYEDYPELYEKKRISVSLRSLLDGSSSGEIEGLIYTMYPSFSLGCPTASYYATCEEGYKRFGFDLGILSKALADSGEGGLG